MQIDRETIIKWADENGLWDYFDLEGDSVGLLMLETFAKLVAEHEREACAKVVEELPAPSEYSMADQSMWDVTCIDCAAAIRARNNNA